ncbi:helix-turn-helix transcriptional regulator [Roseimaritima sediminicola]|uniref:helix-turn-helix transcriptional regulator n=1 Tax=Roseimaritima sediminicola TaxID=2662066 RepID=UPI0013867596|nr:HTH domain-containing protein [Roseimaritima sediminicola]
MPTRLERILRILLLLQTRIPYDAYQLAEEMSVHRRTIFRDIAALRGLGIPIDFDNESACYSLSSQSALNLDRVSVEELSNLLVSACLATEQPSDRSESTKRVALKLCTQLPEPIREEIAKLAMRSQAPSPASSNGWASQLHALPAIAGAIERQQMLEVSVLDPSGACRDQQVRPRSIAFTRHGWTLEGTDDRGAAVRYQADNFPLLKPLQDD